MKNEKAIFSAVAALALIAIVASQTLAISDFVSGLILGVAIVAETGSLVKLLKAMKKEN